MINIALWYVPTAVHMWRFYFRYRECDPNTLTEPSRLAWEACDRAIHAFNDTEIEILRIYYMTSFGSYEDMRVIKEYAENHDINPGAAWDVIKRANYTVIVERGLMDKKEVKQNE